MSAYQDSEQYHNIDTGDLSDRQKFDNMKSDFFTSPAIYLQPRIESLLDTINSDPLLNPNGEASISIDDIIQTITMPEQIVLSRNSTFKNGLTEVQSMRQHIRGGGIPQYVESGNLTQLDKTVFPEEIYYHGLDVGIGTIKEEGKATYKVDDSNFVIVGVFKNDRNTKRYLDLLSTIKILLLNQARSTAPDSVEEA